MKKEELQKMIKQKDHSPERMRKIGESYLEGDVLWDPVAAEAWLLLAIEQGESEDAIYAMEMIARAIYSQEKVISDKDYLDIFLEWKDAGPERKNYLEKMLKLGTADQKRMIGKSNE